MTEFRLSRDLSEIILICWFETFLIIVYVENISAA